MKRARRAQIDAVRQARMEAFDALPSDIRELINNGPQVPDARDVQKLIDRHGEQMAYRMVRTQFKMRFGVVQGP